MAEKSLPFRKICVTNYNYGMKRDVITGVGGDVVTDVNGNVVTGVGYNNQYDVFLSFRGEDTCKTFTDHLYTALVNAGFRTFPDDPELERGEAIQQSRSCVIVLSKDYTSSNWCLDKLVMILERKNSDHVVLPVFYDVENLAKVPKYQKNQSTEKLNRWRTTLREVADLADPVVRNEADGDESKFIQEIVGLIQDKLGLPVPLSVVQEKLRKQLKKLRKKLLDCNPDLDDAEGKQLNNSTVKAWLDRLKEAVYDAEDLLQEIKTEALRQEMEPESGSSTSTVQELVSSPPSHAFESALIISKAEKVLKTLEVLEEQKEKVLGSKARAEPKVYQPIASTCLVQESGVYGRDKEKEAFIQLLLSDDEKISVIPIVGMGGIGKTTLAQLLYNDVKVKEHFKLRAWACVSKEFDVLGISQQIYESLKKKRCKIQNLDLLQSELMEALEGKKFFFVLDDIWDKIYDLWDKLKCPFEFGAHGSKIIVTTRDGGVASMMVTPQHQPQSLMELSENDGWSLLEKHAFKGRTVGGQSHLEKIGRQIVRKCKGLPLAIKTLGGLLCSELTVGKWKSILNSDIWKLPQEESDILPSLWLSYMYLPPHLKRCFAYCSLFPKNYKFQTSELVFLWMAEDLLQPQKMKTAEQIGKDYFNDLSSRSFFQPSYRQYFIMHDLINDLASFVSGEFCFRWEDSDSPNNLSKIRHLSYMIKYADADDDKFDALQQAKCLRTFLLLAPSWIIKWSRRGLHEVLPKLQCLRMLKLSGSRIEELPDSVNNLKHLRHIDMSHSSIKKLPDTICTLYNLQTLFLSDCYYLTELPPNFGRLIKLTHVDVKGTKLIKMPPHMGNLGDLQVLTKFVLDQHTAGDNLLELKKLQNLRKLEMSGLEHGSGVEAYILKDKKFLNVLCLYYRKFGEVNVLEEREVLEKLEPNPDLEGLAIDGYGGEMFPGWLRYYSSSPALVYLQLSGCANCKYLPPLGELPFLRKLHISGLNRVVSIRHEFYYSDDNTYAIKPFRSSKKPFRSLQSLTFQFMSSWQEWSHVGDDDNECCFFPDLRELHLSFCPNLTGRLALDSFPMLNEVSLEEIGFSHLTSSQECPELVGLKLHDCPNFVSFPDGGLHAPNLTDINIGYCKKLGSWPEQMHTLLPSLENLSVSYCPELESFPEGGLPAQLKSLQIEDCKKFSANSFQNRNKGLRRFTSLEELSLDFYECEEVDSFPEKVLLPSTLTSLHISFLSLETMDGDKWFGHLNSLQTLDFKSCELRCLPDTGLPASLSHLVIDRCPRLARRCEREKGEDWPKIAHIRHITIEENDDTDGLDGRGKARCGNVILESGC